MDVLVEPGSDPQALSTRVSETMDSGRVLSPDSSTTTKIKDKLDVIKREDEKPVVEPSMKL